MRPILYRADAKTYAPDSYGYGVLSDVKTCEVKMRGSEFELSMVYPVDGIHYEDIKEERIIFAKPCQTDEPQPFRIYRITTPLGGTVTIYARHISYDLSGIPVLPFPAESAEEFALKLKSNSVIENPFNFHTDITAEKSSEFLTPQTARFLLAENEGSWADVYGGELVFDGFDVFLLKSAGRDRGVKIRYGVDMVDANMERSIAEMYTGILPYAGEGESLVYGAVIKVKLPLEHEKILPVDVSNILGDEEKTPDSVSAAGKSWLGKNDIGKPEINLTIRYAQDGQIVRLYDTITVELPRLGTTVTAKVCETVFDVLRERYSSVSVGEVRQTINVDITDAARLKKGQINPVLIPKNAIATAKIEDKSITSEKLDDELMQMIEEGGLPEVTQAENGKILMVVDGKWAITNFPT